MSPTRSHDEAMAEYYQQHPDHAVEQEPQLDEQLAQLLDEGIYDLVHARLLLEHLPERERALDKLVRSLRVGGWIVIEDVDYVSGIPVSALGGVEHEHTQSVRLQHFARGTQL